MDNQFNFAHTENAIGLAMLSNEPLTSDQQHCKFFSMQTAIQMAEWEFPTPLRIAVATPLSHAALSLLAPVLTAGGAFYVMEAFSPDAFYDLVERVSPGPRVELFARGAKPPAVAGKVARRRRSGSRRRGT